MAGALPTCREKLTRLPDYGYRADAAVPRFPDDKPIIVFDGVCVLCSAFARFVAGRDRDGCFRFVAAQSQLGIALYRHAGLDPVNYETNLLIADGRFFGKMDALAEIMRRLGGVLRLVAMANALPGGVSDRLYDAIAENRYRLFGRTDLCIVPDASWRARMID